MIAHLTGTFAWLTESSGMMVLASGIGYEVELAARSSWPTLADDSRVGMVVHHHQTADADVLFGFPSQVAKDVARLITEVSMVGMTRAHRLVILTGVDALQAAAAIGVRPASLKVKGVSGDKLDEIVSHLHKEWPQALAGPTTTSRANVKGLVDLLQTIGHVVTPAMLRRVNAVVDSAGDVPAAKLVARVLAEN
jgi:Holliday junction resolvasome RuvABC DNA-binding subunit